MTIIDHTNDEATRRVQVLMRDHFCKECRFPHSLNADKLCEFCRPRIKTQVPSTFSDRFRRRHIIILAAIGVMALTVLLYGYLMASNV